jgi:predicted GH43/DUF377 family glycosyl hydrolase
VNDVGLAVRSGLRIRPDPTRVISRLFIPGQELVGGSEARTTMTVERVLALDEAVVAGELKALVARFSDRHHDLGRVFDEHAERVSGYVTGPLSEERRQLLGAVFTHEFSIEGTSVCNPSLVAHPDQNGVGAGSLRVVLSHRAIGEGHRSSIGFRTGLIDAAGLLTFDEPVPFPTVGSTRYSTFRRHVFHGKLNDLGADGENARFVLDGLGDVFTLEELEAGIDQLASQRDTRPNVFDTAVQMRSIAECFYVASFDESSDLSQRVLWPATPGESQGLEDARFVKLSDGEASRYVATYTAFDGRNVTQQLLETHDFVTFHSSPLAGAGASNKGLALFPRRVDGRFAALSRHDRESNSLAFSADLRVWDEVAPLQAPLSSWELLQIGNCGSPIELPQGWLVLTHGVGPMRTYGIGAMLLDLDDPSLILAQLSQPLLLPDEAEQDGYVPNVVYSCGSLVHEGNLYLPYGIADQFMSYATVPITELLAALTPV